MSTPHVFNPSRTEVGNYAEDFNDANEYAKKVVSGVAEQMKHYGQRPTDLSQYLEAPSLYILITDDDCTRYHSTALHRDVGNSKSNELKLFGVAPATIKEFAGKTAEVFQAIKFCRKQLLMDGEYLANSYEHAFLREKHVHIPSNANVFTSDIFNIIYFVPELGLMVCCDVDGVLLSVSGFVDGKMKVVWDFTALPKSSCDAEVVIVGDIRAKYFPLNSQWGYRQSWGGDFINFSLLNEKNEWVVIG